MHKRQEKTTANQSNLSPCPIFDAHQTFLKPITLATYVKSFTNFVWNKQSFRTLLTIWSKSLSCIFGTNTNKQHPTHVCCCCFMYKYETECETYLTNFLHWKQEQYYSSQSYTISIWTLSLTQLLYDVHFPYTIRATLYTDVHFN